MAADPNAGLMNAPAGVDPVDYAKLMRQQQLAAFLQQDALSPIQQTQPQSGVKGLYVQARTSPVAHLAKLAEAVMAAKATDSSNQGMAQAYARGLQAFAPGGAPAPAPVSAPQESPGIGVPPTSGGYGGGAGANDAGQPGTQGRASTPVNPMNPFGQDARALAMLYQTDKPKYLEMVRGTPEYQNMLAAAHGNHDLAQAMMAVKVSKDAQTTEYLNALNAAGGDPVLAQRILLAKATKDSTVELRTGNTNLDLLSGRAQIAPDPERGAYFTGDPLNPGPDGVRAVGIRNSDKIAADRAGLVTAAQESNRPVIVHDQYGRETFATPQLASGALAGPQAPSTPPLRSLGQTAPGAPTAAPASSPTAPPPASAPPGALAPRTGATPVRSYFPTAPGGGQTTAGKESQEEGGKSSAEFGSALADDSNGALEVRRGLHELRNLANQQTPGAQNLARVKVAQYFMAAGLSPERTQEILHVDSGVMEAAKKGTSGLAVSSIHQMTNRGTNFDLETFMENNPNLLQTPGGFQRVIDYMDGKSASIIEKQREYQKFDPERKIPADERKAAFTAYWNEKQEQAIAKGKYDSRIPRAPGDKRPDLATFEKP